MILSSTISCFSIKSPIFLNSSEKLYLFTNVRTADDHYALNNGSRPLAISFNLLSTSDETVLILGPI